MKVCHMEAMKEIRLLEEQKNMLLHEECERFRVSYKEGETRMDTGYCYQETREQIAALDARIRQIKAALAVANCNWYIERFQVTIGEALVMLAQWTAEHARLSMLAAQQQKTRRITQNGILEYTECLCDVAEVAKERDALKRKISALQVEIDRANLFSQIEI